MCSNPPFVSKMISQSVRINVNYRAYWILIIKIRNLFYLLFLLAAGFKGWTIAGFHCCFPFLMADRGLDKLLMVWRILLWCFWGMSWFCFILSYLSDHCRPCRESDGLVFWQGSIFEGSLYQKCHIIFLIMTIFHDSCLQELIPVSPICRENFWMNIWNGCL